MTKKNVMKAIEDANKKAKKNTIIAASAAGATGLLAAAGAYLLGKRENDKTNDSITDIDNRLTNTEKDVKCLDTKITSVVSIIAEATTTPADDDATRNKFITINMFVMADALERTKDLYTKTKRSTRDGEGRITAEAEYTKMTNPTLSDFKEKVIYMKEDDYNKMYKADEDTDDKEDKADDTDTKEKTKNKNKK